MATKSGKVQLKDIKRGKTFYVVKADFPIISAGVVGLGEIESVLRVRVTSRPYWRRLSATPAFDFVNDAGREGYVHLDRMAANHALAELTEEMPYFVVLATKRAVDRFVKTFEDRPPSKAETVRTLLREAGLHGKQRGLAYTPQFKGK
jgi:hypothetical protein